jgi:transaldolase
VELHSSARWLALQSKGARPQRLLYASTGTKDPKLPPSLYVAGLASPITVNTVPEATLQAFHADGAVTAVLPPDGGPLRAALAEAKAAGIDLAGTAAALQKQGAEAFEKSWADMLADIRSKSGALAS